MGARGYPVRATHPLLASRGGRVRFGALGSTQRHGSGSAPRSNVRKRSLAYALGPEPTSQQSQDVGKVWTGQGMARPRPRSVMTGRTMVWPAVSDGRLHARFRGFGVLETLEREQTTEKGFPQDQIRRAWEAVACPNGNEDARGEQGVQWAAPACRWPRVASIPG